MAIFFPDDFLEWDGRFRATMPGDFVPIAYILTDGTWICAECMTALNDLGQFDHYEFLYEGPPVVCDRCDALLFALDDPDRAE